MRSVQRLTCLLKKKDAQETYAQNEHSENSNKNYAGYVIEEKLMRTDNMQKSLAEIIESTITDSIVTTLASLAGGRMSLHRVTHIPPS